MPSLGEAEAGHVAASEHGESSLASRSWPTLLTGLPGRCGGRRRGHAAGLAGGVLEAKSPSKRITIGCIGLGNEGFGHNTQQFLVEPDAQVLAVCDVKAKHRTRAKDAVDAKYGNKDCREYVDFREVLAQGYRRRDDRHAGPLARAPVASGAGGRQGRVL